MVVILTGVSGSGKTTLGLRLADDLGWTFIDADDFHSPDTFRKIARGEWLSEAEDRSWRRSLRDRVQAAIFHRENAVLACAALKSGSRSDLCVDREAVRFVYLKGDAHLVRQRLRHRSGHFLREDLLLSQFATLEEPEDAVVVDIDERPGRIVETIRRALAL